MRRRQSHRTLTGSRIYQRRGRFYYFAPEPVLNPKTGRVTRWVNLCPVSDGELAARVLLAELFPVGASATDFTRHLDAYKLRVLKKREADRPKEVARVAIFEQSGKEFVRQCREIGTAFEAFNVIQVEPVDIARFLDQWEGRRMAEVYKATLSKFFAWCVRTGLRSDNPVRDVTVEKSSKRDRLLSPEEFRAVRDALLAGKDKRITQSGAMVQCYVDLCYYLYQRTTEIRLLKWSDVKDDVIMFKPTKTEKSSGAKVAVPITPAIRAALDRAKSLGTVKGLYVIHARKGQAYDAHGLGTAWRRACQRAGVEDATLKDIRAMAASAAKQQGYELTEISVGLAHTDTKMTEHYVRGRETPVSQVKLKEMGK